MTAAGTILQVVPRLPGHREGVGDYAQILATGLRQRHAYETVFRTGADLDETPPAASALVLHYVNYGYHPRGVPGSLPQKVERLRKHCAGRLVTIFHELYASGSWRQSAFWLRPLQKQITRRIARDSAVCIVSSAILAGQLRRLAPAAHVVVSPVLSTFGEPTLTATQIAGRDPQRWIICGGTELIRRSLRSFPDAAELFVVGGADRPEIRATLAPQHYFPDVDAAAASEILSSCAFGWLDYFETTGVPTAAILKSTAFAAYCAHGVIPVFPVAGSPIALDDDAMPGPFFPGNLPSEAERPAIAQAIYEWYQRHAASGHLVDTIARAISP